MRDFRHPRDDRGSVTLFAVVLAFALLLVAGLVLDGSAKLTGQRRVDNEAEQAARAGAQAVDLSTLRATGTARLDAGAARTAALRFLGTAGYPDGQVTVTGRDITVRLTAQQPTKVLGVIGIRTFTLTGTGRARLLDGVSEAGP